MSKISDLSLRDLESVIAVADHGHFGKAAQSVHLSQPALSAQIKKVEDFLGVLVFERNNRRVVTTPVGLRIAAQARAVLDEASKIQDIARGETEVLGGEFRLGAIASLGPYYLPYLLAPFRKKFPHADLLLQEGLTDPLLEDLREGRLDAVLASPTFSPEGLRLLPIFVEPLVLIAPKESEIANKPGLKPADLKPQDMVMLQDGHCLRDQTIDICPVGRRSRQAGPFSEKFQATGIETLRYLVATGQGYSLIPALAVREDLKLKGLIRYRAFEDKTVSRKIVLVCRDRYPKMGDIDALARLMRETAPESVRRA